MIPQPIRTQVRDAVRRGWERAVAEGSLAPLGGDASAPDVEVEHPANPDHGDLATNLAMKLARPYRKAPMEIATLLAAKIVRDAADGPSPVEAVEVAPPGFLNVRIKPAALEAVVDGILSEPGAWGQVEPTSTRSVNVEFVSANPTGPLTVGNARGAFVGDLLSRVLEAGGQRVTREYYFNDVGGQIPNLGASIVALKRGEPVPENGYHGEYVGELATQVPDEVWNEATAPGADSAALVGHWAAGLVREGIEASLERLGVHFDVWTTEASLHEAGWVERAVERLREHGDVYELDGAVWFRSTTYGDDKDRVIYRSNGEPTYFAADIGYVAEKFSRGFDHLIYIWGADHHGTIARNRGAAEAMGYPREHVQMLIMGWVHFVRPWQPGDDESKVRIVGGKKMTKVGMSKREGTFDTLDDLLAEVGIDAARWYFASRSANMDIDFDFGHLREVRELVERRRLRERTPGEDAEKGVDLGVYYVQYAHARIASILRKAEDAGLKPAMTVAGTLGDGPEAALARAIVRLPEVVEDAVGGEETQGITAYATELATAFHAFYRDARVIDPAEPNRSASRLALARAAQVTLAQTLGLLGISAPEAM
ncbi:MAG TPA: arginine--tRNA ligase [Candidatus Limnocylindrales bacterium]|nr:arginine--tRNA ligase [Candidatus Limnocylindrales bacterium]